MSASSSKDISSKNISTMKDYGTATSSATPVPIPLLQNDSTSAIPASRKSSESANPMNIEEPSITPALAH